MPRTRNSFADLQARAALLGWTYDYDDNSDHPWSLTMGRGDVMTFKSAATAIEKIEAAEKDIAARVDAIWNGGAR